jgi:hypothetical protein
MARTGPETSGFKATERAIALISTALDILDARVDCPEAATHLDLALRRLRESIANNQKR